jgi:ComF family protein
MLGFLGKTGRMLAQGLLQILYPGVCNVCGRALTPEEAGCCTGCRSILTHDPYPSCSRCGATVGPYVAGPDDCPHCRGAHFYFDRTCRLGPYQGRLRELILLMKRRRHAELAELLGYIWAEHSAARLQAEACDAVVPVPLHWRRRWWRGYNQSDTLARHLAARLGLACQPRWLRRIRHTPQQTLQTPAERRTNVRGAFAAAPGTDLSGQAVLLVDDVMTTGSTCSEAARALKRAGAVRVVAAILSHG